MNEIFKFILDRDTPQLVIYLIGRSRGNYAPMASKLHEERPHDMIGSLLPLCFREQLRRAKFYF
jgi:hypothetical protein